MNKYLITYETNNGEQRSTAIMAPAAENARNTLKKHIANVKKILTTIKVK